MSCSPLPFAGLFSANARRARLRLRAAPRAFRYLARYIFFVAAVFLLTAPAIAQVSREYQLKAVFLWRLAQFTEWPGDAFDSPDSPIIICVLGDNPFDGALNAAVAGETAHGRRFIVQYHRGIDNLRICHILYMGSVGPRQAKEIGAALAGRSVLTVRNGETTASFYETIVRFATEQNRIKLRINLKAATAARLVFDPRLLRSAEIVGYE